MTRFFVGILLGILLVPLALLGWLKFGNVPVAVADPQLSKEKMLTGMPLHARIDREMVKTPPIPANEDNLVAGAEVYNNNCAGCHGVHGKPSTFGKHMFPAAPPLFEAHHHGSETVMGVTDDPPGETYWKVANGIRLTGMPSYKGILTENQMWQVSLLLANADKPLPPAALTLLRAEPQPPALPAAPVSAKKK